MTSMRFDRSASSTDSPSKPRTIEISEQTTINT